MANRLALARQVGVQVGLRGVVVHGQPPCRITEARGELDGFAQFVSTRQRRYARALSGVHGGPDLLRPRFRPGDVREQEVHHRCPDALTLPRAIHDQVGKLRVGSRVSEGDDSHC